MENQVIEFEKQQKEITKNTQTVLSKLEASYNESENLINLIKRKQHELLTVRKKLWITIIIMAVIVTGLFLLKAYL